MYEDETSQSRDDLDGIVPGLSGTALGRHLFGAMEADRLRRSVEGKPPGPHPEPERLLALRAGELRPEEEEPLLAHLGECEDCTGMVAFFAAAGNPEPVEAEELEATWSRLPGRLTREPEPILEARRTSRPPMGSRWRAMGRRWAESLAGGAGSWRLGAELVGIAALVVVVGLWRSDRVQLAQLTTPQANVAVYELADITYRGMTRGATSLSETLGAGAARGASDGSTVRDPEHANTRRIELEPGEELFTLALDVEADHPRYRIRLLDSTGAERWVDDRLKVDDYGIALVGLHRRFLEDGRFTLEVMAGREGREAKRWVFPIEIIAP